MVETNACAMRASCIMPHGAFLVHTHSLALVLHVALVLSAAVLGTSTTLPGACRRRVVGRPVAMQSAAAPPSKRARSGSAGDSKAKSTRDKSLFMGHISESDHYETHGRKAIKVHARDDNSAGSIRATCRDGRQCKLCGAKDNSPDEIIADELIFWARPPRQQNKGHVPHGHVCLYCDRVFTRRFAVAYKGGIEAFTIEVGKDQKLLDDFRSWRCRLIEYIKESGGSHKFTACIRHCVAPWRPDLI